MHSANRKLTIHRSAKIATEIDRKMTDINNTLDTHEYPDLRIVLNYLKQRSNIMCERQSDIENYWDDFEQQFNEWVAGTLAFAEIDKFFCAYWNNQVQSNGTTKVPPTALVQNSNEMQFCLANDCFFCSYCQPLCDIHITKPCENNWSSLVETCCDMCNIQCETECPIQNSSILLYVLTPIFSILGTVRFPKKILLAQMLLKSCRI